MAVNDAGQPGSYHWPYQNDDFPASDVPGLAGAAGDYLTDRLVDSAVDFLERHARESFFLVLAHYTVHTPIQGRADLQAHHEERLRRLFAGSPTPFGAEHARATTRLRQDRADYAAMVASSPW